MYRFFLQGRSDRSLLFSDVFAASHMALTIFFKSSLLPTKALGSDCKSFAYWLVGLAISNCEAKSTSTT
uniref:Uncharacterized protein n=1 Tax=Rhizophora mucronata TaxID=61149 RepID=A0A2P2PP21_RHIMU